MYLTATVQENILLKYVKLLQITAVFRITMLNMFSPVEAC